MANKEITIFAKKRTNKEGKTFVSYITTLSRKDGSTLTVSVKFREEAGTPKECPCNIIVDKPDMNLQARKYIREDTGEMAEAYTLWITAWKPGSKYIDHSLDDFDV